MNRYIKFFQPWFEHTFGVRLIQKPRLRYSPSYACLATRFLAEARADGWAFGRWDWHIPNWVLQQYPRMVLQYWLTFKARLFIFVVREGSPDRTACTLKSIAINVRGLQQIASLLDYYHVDYRWGHHTKLYADHMNLQQEFFQHGKRMTFKKKYKETHFLVLFGFAAIQKLFLVVGNSPLYQWNHRLLLFQQLAQSHLDYLTQMMYNTSNEHYTTIPESNRTVSRSFARRPA